MVIGAGFGGIAAAARLHQLGMTNIVVLEEADDLGGTWRENTYPGCACDVPSALYSYSFAPNPDWTRTYAGHAEIHQYLRRTARDLGVTGLIRYGTHLESAQWNQDAQHWILHTSGEAMTTRWVIAACGPLHRPAVPDIPGLDTFAGKIFHSARWDHSHDLTGRRVAVLGTGASAIQFVPEIQPVVGSLLILQRTAQWVLPKPDWAVGRAQRLLYRHVPVTQRFIRRIIHAAFEFTMFGVRHPLALRPLERVSRGYMRRHIKDPELRQRMHVDFALGCKRILLSNHWYQALAQDNAHIVDGNVREVRPNSIIDGEGVEHPIDTLILATGYHAASPPVANLFSDAHGRKMIDYFEDGGARAYLGTHVAGLPNLFVLTGPNSFVYSSIVDVIEAQIARISAALEFARQNNIGSMSVSARVQDRYNAELQEALSTTVWASGCSSWFLDTHGQNTTMWPWSTSELRRRVGNFDPTDFDLELVREVVAAR